ncbi:hypothetical protein BpHYR1_003860 [Brachionus plicatilis]|uniref:Uncharacterized protein n=1 Tax=Brachionus plicatilis TaxID=10195 RepID=A0A3M7P9S7_BRAPC|nr:hypothetical protein BpHYR1_003860 [Brachionus plicatilis]
MEYLKYSNTNLVSDLQKFVDSITNGENYLNSNQISKTNSLSSVSSNSSVDSTSSSSPASKNECKYSLVKSSQ